MKKIIILVIVVIAVVGIAGYLYFSKTAETPLSKVIPESIKDIKEKLGGGPNTSNWATYKDTSSGASIKYPSNYEVQEGGEGIFFIPPELKNITEQPKTLKELPLGIFTPSDKSYDEIRGEIKKQSGAVEYSEETTKVIIGIEGVELKLGPNLGSDSGSAGTANLHKLYNIVPYKGEVLIFMTYALSKKQLEGQGAQLLDAFISTFKSE